MKLPSPPQWDRIHELVEVLEPLSPPERDTHLRGMGEEDALVLSCLRAHFLVPEPITELKPGTVLAEKYTIVSRLGEGGMGVVYRARQKHTQRDVAVKLIHPQLVSPELRARFEQEIATLGRLRHPSLVQVFDADVFCDAEAGQASLFYAMELVDGLRLNDWSAQRHPSLEERLAVMASVCEAVQAAHAEGIVHRDLKPQNILVDAGARPVVLDFGLARLRGQWLEISDVVETDAVSLLSGTPLYTAPELAQRGGAVAAQPGDIYALGLIAFQLFARRLPFDLPSGAAQKDVVEAVATQTPHQLLEFLPQADPLLNEAVMRAFRRDPKDRYATAADFAVALRGQIGRRDRLRRRTRLAAIFGVLAAASTVAALVAWRASAEAETRRAEAAVAEKKTDALVDFMVRDLRDKLEQTGRLDLLVDVLDQAEKHYQEKRLAHGDSPETRLLLAGFLQVKAGVLNAHGQRGEALKLLEESVELAEAAPSPRTATPSPALAQALQRLGYHHLNHGAFAEAHAVFERELQAARRAGNQHAEARAHRDVASALGYLQAWDPCRAGYLESQRLLRHLATAQPANQTFAAELAELEASLGSLEETVGNFPAMLEHFTAYHRQVTERSGKESAAYSYSAFRMGVAHVKMGHPAEAVPFLQDAVRLAQREVARRPGDRGQLGHLSACLNRLAQAFEGIGDTPAATRAREREAAIQEAISAPEPQTAK